MTAWSRDCRRKPFKQQSSALNESLHKHFGEQQIYRIDHYLGKETVQNILMLLIRQCDLL